MCYTIHTYAPIITYRVPIVAYIEYAQLAFPQGLGYVPRLMLIAARSCQTLRLLSVHYYLSFSTIFPLLYTVPEQLSIVLFVVF